MREKSLIIICITLIICVSLICGTILLTNNQDNRNNTNNTLNNTTVNSTLNETNKTNNTTETTSYSSKTSKSTSKSSSSSSYSSRPTGYNVPTLDSNGNRVFRDGEWVGRGPGGAHIYKDPRSGELFDSGGNLPSNYKYDPR